MRRVIDDTRLANIASTIREKTGKTTTYTDEEMAGGVAEVYDAGIEAERRAFWKVYQDDGARTNWQYAFYYFFWTDATYNPIYLIKVGNTNTNMFYRTLITDTKVPIDIRGTTLNYTFRGAGIITIRELIVDESTDIANGFTNGNALVNLTVTGTIGKDWKTNACPLSAESGKSILLALKDYAGTDSEYTKTVTLRSSTWTALAAEGATAPGGVTWREYVTAKGWIAA